MCEKDVAKKKINKMVYILVTIGITQYDQFSYLGKEYYPLRIV